MVVWFPTWTWSTPVYYEYGSGGNVVYENNVVYVDGKQVATADEYAKSATTLASVTPPSNETPDNKDDWMPLGSFAVFPQADAEHPTQTLQLAVNKQGVLSGVLYNLANETAVAIHGSVDKTTQRAAFTLDEKGQRVAEVGLANLTKDNASLLVHEGAGKTTVYHLNRLAAPPAAQEATGAK